MQGDDFLEPGTVPVHFGPLSPPDIINDNNIIQISYP